MKVSFFPALMIAILSLALGASFLLIYSGNGLSPIASTIFGSNNVPVVGGFLQEGEASRLPHFVDVHDEPKLKAGDASLGTPYFRIYPHWMDNFGERHCEECTMIEYSAAGPNRQAAVAYQSDTLLDLTGAKRIKFFAMGEYGGEKVSFMGAGKDIKIDSKADLASDKAMGIFKDKQFGIATQKVTLKDTWTRFEISLDGQEMSAIQYPFGLQIDGDSVTQGKVRLYLKNIVIDTEAPVEPIPLNATSIT
jgi:hypothetical protein